MASDTKNVKIGVCKIFLDGVDLGFTKGGVEVSVQTETHKVQIDQFGKTPINEYIMGRSVNIKVPLAETTLENLAATMPGATLVRGANNIPTRVDVPVGVGQNLLDFAKPLTLHPIGKADGDTSEDFVVPLAATAGALSFAYKLEDERVFNVEFNGYPDSNGKLFSVGAQAAVTP